MDGRSANPDVLNRHSRDATPRDHAPSRGYHMVGWREHQTLVAEGHYRCPDCCRVDAMEADPGHASRP
jgi:hypothetical protein